MRTIAHVYPSYTEATHVVTALESAGIPHDQISIVSGDKSAETGTASGVTSGDAAQGASTGAGTGATLGTVLGGGAGLLAGIGSLAIPGVGPIVAAGWLVAALTGAGVGAAAGGLIGSLTGAGISEADAKAYEHGVSSGGTLVTVRVEDAQAAHVEQVMGLQSQSSTGLDTRPATTGIMADPATGAGPLGATPTTAPFAGGTRTIGASTTEPESTARRDAETDAPR